MIAAVFSDPVVEERSARAPFGPVATIVLAPAIAVVALMLAVGAGVLTAALFDPAGLSGFLGDFLDGALVDGSPRLERVEGWFVLYWAPFTLVLLFAVAWLKRGAGFSRMLGLGGTLPPRVAGLAALAIVTIIAVESVLALYFPYLRELFVLPRDSVALFLTAVGAVLGAPVAEEVLFRGFMFTAIRARWGFWPALLVPAVMFSAMHFDPTGVYALLVLPSALLLGWIREKTGGVYAPILAHAVFNAAAVGGQLLERL